MKIEITVDDEAGVYRVRISIPNKLSDAKSYDAVLRGQFEPNLSSKSDSIARGYSLAQWIATAGLLHELRDMSEREREDVIKAENAAFVARNS